MRIRPFLLILVLMAAGACSGAVSKPESTFEVTMEASIESLTPNASVQVPTMRPAPTPTPEEKVDPVSGLDWVDIADLPPEAADTLALIESDGPFPFDRDGITFENREAILPDERGGYYLEYTVPTPGESDRGARRIVTGDGGEAYYTGDHYDSFQRIRLP